MRLRSPIVWYGGKGLMVAKLLPLVPRHRVYVEPFGGGASLLFAKSVADVEVYNDLDEGLVNFFRVLRNEGQARRLKWLLDRTPYARGEWQECRRLLDREADVVRKAWRWLVVCRMSFSGMFGSGWSCSRGNGGVDRWRTCGRMLLECAARFEHVQVECQGWRDVVRRHDSAETFFYMDPPYVQSTRSGTRYAVDFDEKEHEELVRWLLGLRGKVMLSGYLSDVYRPLEEAGWVRNMWGTACHTLYSTDGKFSGAGARLRGARRVEVVWRNYRLIRDEKTLAVDRLAWETGRREPQ